MIARVDTLGNTTSTSYSSDGRTVSVQNPNTSTRVTTRSANGDTLSITGTAVTPEFHTYDILPDGTRWSRIVQGETANSPRFTKRYENLLGQIVREERSGFQGAVLATTHVYDSYGRLVSTTADYEPVVEYIYDTSGTRCASIRRADGQWRKTETASYFSLLDGNCWLTQTNIVSCSDVSISPLVTSSSSQYTGLLPMLLSRYRTTDIHGNQTENEMHVVSQSMILRKTVPSASEDRILLFRYSFPMMAVSISSVTNTYVYDSMGRRIAVVDGRGNINVACYNGLGQKTVSIDALGNRTTYAYDQFGNLISATDSLGNTTVYEYDLLGRKTYEGGAAHPVRYVYNVFGNMTTMMTYRDETLGRNSGDATTWLYDEPSGTMTNKVYADGKGPIYFYRSDGKILRRIWARGIVTEYSYDGWNNLTNTTYSDDTPPVTLFYDAMGRQTAVHDAAGVTTFVYDSFGALTNETIVGVAGMNIIERYWDEFGRTTGYALNGTRQTVISYDQATGRITSMVTYGSDTPFVWDSLSGSDLRSSLTYPNGLIASWQYDAKGQLIQACNAMSTNVISQYDYIYDAAGRRVSCAHSGSAFSQTDTISYNYNVRSELTNSFAAVDENYSCTYQYDDIGNRKTSTECGLNSIYIANQLNQYSSVDDFSAEFDDDGNQTTIKTSTGLWTVMYNGENRPKYMSNGITNVVMVFDWIGRRVKIEEFLPVISTIATNITVATEDSTFIYDDYACIMRKRELYDGDLKADFFIWNPDERVATRPIVMIASENQVFYYTHDGNKSVSELINFHMGNRIEGHYQYYSYGNSSIEVAIDLPHEFSPSVYNPFTFSSEYHDRILNLMYFNYRHYHSGVGRWLVRDVVEEIGGINLYAFCGNNPISFWDYLGLKGTVTHGTQSCNLLCDDCYDLARKFKLWMDHYLERYWELIEDKYNYKITNPKRYNDHRQKVLEAESNIRDCAYFIFLKCNGVVPIPAFYPKMLPDPVTLFDDFTDSNRFECVPKWALGTGAAVCGFGAAAMLICPADGPFGEIALGTLAIRLWQAASGCGCL